MAQVSPVDSQPVKASTGALSALEGIGKLSIQQEVNLLEAAMDAVGMGCCEQPNIYNVYDGEAFNAAMDAATNDEEVAAAKVQHQLLTINELGQTGCNSATICRLCFNPFHTMKLAVTDKKNGNAPIFWIDRPFKCCGCAYLCCSCCLQEWNVHEGSVPTTEDSEQRKAEMDASKVGAVRQPPCGGGCFPKFNVYGLDDVVPAAIIRGPHCIGELCCSVDFRLMAPKKEGEKEEELIGTITKLGAKGGMGALKELLTDADNFEIDMTVGSKNFSVEEKAAALTGLVLLDFYFFENGGALECNPCPAPGEPYCKLNVCTEYCCGTLVPWTISYNKGDGS